MTRSTLTPSLRQKRKALNRKATLFVRQDFRVGNARMDNLLKDHSKALEVRPVGSIRPQNEIA
jgi:hypothetical protein